MLGIRQFPPDSLSLAESAFIQLLEVFYLANLPAKIAFSLRLDISLSYC
jgi:hypothetical protein